jgi:hypothetical protein
VTGNFEHSNEHSGFINGEGFIGQMKDYWFRREIIFHAIRTY